MNDLNADDVALDLLSAWQSLHALLPANLRLQVSDLNEQTCAFLLTRMAEQDGLYGGESA